MINILIGNKSNKEINIACQQLADDKNYRIDSVFTGKDIINMYWNINPDILILDSSISDISLEDIVNRLSCNPIERKRCNTILTLSPHYNLRLNNVAKINEIIYTPIANNELLNIIKLMSIDHNTPDLEVGEVDWLLQSLNFNCMSPGYKYMKDAIIYCYYRPDELEFLNTILKYLSYTYNVPESRIRDSLKSSIRPFNNTNILCDSSDLYKVLYNNGNKLSLKDFLERIVFYLIKTKKKGRIF